MSDWQTLLGVTWPDTLCDQSGECCRGAAQLAPWRTLLVQAAAGDETSRDFLNQFVPYPNRVAAELGAPHAVAASLQLAAERGDVLEDVMFYRCRYLQGQNQCLVYEDRPTLCREFPESPFGAIPSCCGYATLAKICHEKVDALRRELAYYKALQTGEQPGSQTESSS